MGLVLAGGPWLVVAGGVDNQFADEFAGGGVDDSDVEVVDEFDDAGCAVGPADADVVESAVDAKGEFAVFVDDVVQDAVPGDQYKYMVRKGYTWGPNGAKTSETGTPAAVDVPHGHLGN